MVEVGGKLVHLNFFLLKSLLQDLQKKLTLDNESSKDSSLYSMTQSMRSSSQENYDLSKFGRSRSISRLKKLYEKRKVAKLFLASQNEKKIEEKLPPMQMKEEENIQEVRYEL